jgi:Arc/MetJ family transcription regulator
MASGPRGRVPRRAISGRAGGKTRITIRIDDDVLAWFRRQVRPTGGSYQTAIDLALRDYIAREPLEATLRRVVREELARAQGRTSPHAYGYEGLRPALVADDVGPESEYGASLRIRQRRDRRRRRR